MAGLDEYMKNKIRNSFVHVTTSTKVNVLPEFEEIVAYIKYDEAAYHVSFLYKNVYKNPERALLQYSICHPDPAEDNRFTAPIGRVPPVREGLKNMSIADATAALPLIPANCRFTSVDFDLYIPAYYCEQEQYQAVVNHAVQNFCDLVNNNKQLFNVKEFSFHTAEPHSNPNLVCLRRILDTFGIDLDCRLTRMHPKVADLLLGYNTKFAGTTCSLPPLCFHNFLGIIATHGDNILAEDAMLTIHVSDVTLISDATLELAIDLSRRNNFNAREIRFTGPRRRQNDETCFYPLRCCPIVGYNVRKERGTIVAVQKFTRVSINVDSMFLLAPGNKYELRIMAKERVLFQWNCSYARFTHPDFSEPHILEEGEEAILSEELPAELWKNPYSPCVAFTYAELRGDSPIKPSWMTRHWAGKEVPLHEAPFVASAAQVEELGNPNQHLPPGCAIH